MNNIVVELSTSNMIVFHSIQRMVYQYHTMFSGGYRVSYGELVDAWFSRIFKNDDKFNSEGGTRVATYELNEDRLVINIIQPFYARDFIIELTKPIDSCVGIVGDSGTISDVNIFSVQYKLPNDANG